MYISVKYKPGMVVYGKYIAFVYLSLSELIIPVFIVFITNSSVLFIHHRIVQQLSRHFSDNHSVIYFITVFCLLCHFGVILYLETLIFISGL